MSEKQDFSATLRLPKTDFPMRAGLPVQEPKWVAKWLEEDVYGKLRAKRVAENAPKFIVHLGPPYANGNFHMGHALTYVLKDLVVRSKFMAGFDSPYAPGWDCHGLPIEWKVEQDLRKDGKTKRDVSVKELRKRCRTYAQGWVDVQKAEWQRLGALGDWERPYLTMGAHNEAGILRELGKMVQRGLVYRGLRPTMWSWAEETALAEAEVEYKDVTSTAVYVALPIVGRENEHVVIWTTTPWTLPANRAVAVKADEEYIRTDEESKEDASIVRSFWIAKKLADDFAKAYPVRIVTNKVVFGSDLVGKEVGHPLYPGRTGRVVEGFHVTTDSGTGIVHIAPAHGDEDFQIGQQQNPPLDNVSPVLGNGTYADWVEKELAEDSELRGKLAGKLIWKAQKDIIEELKRAGRLLKAYDYPHSVAISWRSKEQLIRLTTYQWFVDLDKQIPELDGKSVREASLARIYGDGARGVKWVPEKGMNRIGEMIKHRPDWCISRQRMWGVPVALMVDKASGEIVSDPVVWEHVAQLVEREHIDAWDDRLGGREAELFPEGWLKAKGKSADDFEYVRDILDVWFDSGTTHAHVLRADSGPGQRFERTDGKRPADLYQEGSDQHRGWFHSSLLTSVANYGDAPYEQVVTSGFVVDGEGRKFSKSLGNGVMPNQLWDKYGMDIIRLWVANSDYSEDIRYSPAVMDGMADMYRKFRNTLRWLLGNLDGFEAKQAVAYADLPELEQYILHELAGTLATVTKAYEEYQFHKAIKALFDFCNGTLSNFYFDVRKDVLYCDPAGSAERLSCLTVLDIVFKALVTHLAPVLVFTSEEAWRSRFGEAESVHIQVFEAVSSAWRRDEEFATRWKHAMDIRNIVNYGIEQKRVGGEIGANITASVSLSKSNKDLFSVKVWADILNVSSVAFNEASVEQSIFVAPAAGHKCARCWKYYDELTSEGVCARCDEALAEVKDKAA